MISLNALITPGDNSIMIVAIKWGFHQDGQTGGGGGGGGGGRREAVIPPAHDTAANIVKLGYFGRIDQANRKSHECSRTSSPAAGAPHSGVSLTLWRDAAGLGGKSPRIEPPHPTPPRRLLVRFQMRNLWGNSKKKNCSLIFEVCVFCLLSCETPLHCLF